MSESAPPSSRYEDLAVEMTRDLIALDTTNPPGNEIRAAEYLLERAGELGLIADIHPLSDGRANISIALPDTDESLPTLMYCGHLDTVIIGARPWSYPPFSASIADGRIWGRGAVDMKSGVAAMIAGMAAHVESGARRTCHVRFAGLAGEEVDCYGSHSYIGQGHMDDVDALIISEPTNLRVALAHKGALRVELTVRGVAAHGAMPEAGTNAIDYMVALLAAIRDVHAIPVPHTLLTEPTLSVNRIDGGHRTNIVAESCRAELDIRTVPGQSHDEILERLRAAAASVAATRSTLEISVTTMQSVPAIECPSNHALALSAADAVYAVTDTPATFVGVPYFSDASVLSPPRSIPTLLFGPGDESLAHGVDENVEISQIVTATRVFSTIPSLIWGSR